MKNYGKLRRGLNRVKRQSIEMRKIHLEALRLKRYDISNLWVDYVPPKNNEEGC